MMMESIWKAREEIAYWSKKVQEYGFVSVTDGNLSIRLDEERVLITPSGVPKGEVELESPIIIDMEGNKIEGEGRPSSEGKLHLEVYKVRPDVTAVIHAHPPKCIAFTVAGVPIDTCLLPEVVITMGAIPTSPYATPTTDEVPVSIRPHIVKSNAVMMARHGSLTVGKTLRDAFRLLEKMEHCATIALYAKMLGGPVPFSEGELEKLYALRDRGGNGIEPPLCTDGGSCSAQPREKLSEYAEPMGTCSLYRNPEEAGYSGMNGGNNTFQVDTEQMVDIITRQVKEKLGMP